jgi:hypothetical protein
MTSGKKILGVTGSIVLLLATGKIGLGFLNQPDDKTLITEAIKEAQKAGKEGRPGGVIEFLDIPQLKVNDVEANGAGKDISNYIKNMKPDIEFTKIEPIITGDDARIETPATVKVGVAMFSKDMTLPNVVINLKKEVVHEWLFIPKKSWKITEIRAPAADLASFASGN